MTPVLELVIPGAPVGASRPRVVRLKTGKSHTFIDDKAVSWEEHTRQQAVAAWQKREPLTGPVGVSILSVHKRPGRLCRKRDPRGRVLACCKPDIDNIAKLAMDALSKAGIYNDDTQVVRLRAESWYQAIGDHVRGAPTPVAEQPRVVVAVFDLEEP